MLVKRWGYCRRYGCCCSNCIEWDRKIEQQDQLLIDKYNDAISLALSFLDHELHLKDYFVMEVA